MKSPVIRLGCPSLGECASLSHQKGLCAYYFMWACTRCVLGKMVVGWVNLLYARALTEVANANDGILICAWG